MDCLTYKILWIRSNSLAAMKNGHMVIFSSFRFEMIAWAKIALAKVICFTARLATTAVDI